MEILVALDLSQATSQLLAQARQLAPLPSARIWLIHVAAPNPDFVGYEPGPQYVRDQVAAQHHQEHRQLQQHAEELRQAGFEATALLVQGPTCETLLQEAERLKAGLIILGSHGHGALYHLLLGSVSQGVLRKAACPVLVVPTRA